jgi:hypothetical protein
MDTAYEEEEEKFEARSSKFETSGAEAWTNSGNDEFRIFTTAPPPSPPQT